MGLNDSPSLGALLAGRVAATPDGLAYADAERSITFAELDQTSRQIAAGLQAEGVEPGDRLAIVMSAGAAFAEVFWAAQRLGAVPCALNPMVPAETIGRRAARIRPRLVIDDASAPALARPGTPDEADVGPDDLAYLQTTSGTTGEPRAAMVTQRNVLAYQAVNDALASEVGGEVLVTWVPHWHDLGLVNFVVRPVHHGVPCHIVRPAVSTIPLWIETMSAVGATGSGAPDFALRLAARLVDPRKVDITALRGMTNGGEPVSARTVTAFEERFGVPGAVLPGYGLAEATLGVTTRLPGDPPAVDDRGNVSCGRPLAGIEVRAGTDPEAPGEILVRGETVFAGYLDDEEATRAVLRDGWLHTGDVGYVDDEDQLYVLGRQRAMIKRGGAVLAPRELEEAALAVPGVRLAAAVGIAGREAGTEEIVVMVEAERDGSPDDAIAGTVADAVRRRIGFAPERVLVVPPRAIPITPNGKVRHAQLVAQLTDRPAG